MQGSGCIWIPGLAAPQSCFMSFGTAPVGNYNGGQPMSLDTPYAYRHYTPTSVLVEQPQLHFGATSGTGDGGSIATTDVSTVSTSAPIKWLEFPTLGEVVAMEGTQMVLTTIHQEATGLSHKGHEFQWWIAQYHTCLRSPIQHLPNWRCDLGRTSHDGR